MSSKANVTNYPYGVPPPTDMPMESSSEDLKKRPTTRRLESAAPQRQSNNANQAKNAERSALTKGSPQRLANANSIMQIEDTLEYFIRFPAPSLRNDMEVSDSDFVFVYNESNVPIVMLLGWAGCQDRYLMKYSKIYEDRGLITVRYTAPVDTLFWKRTAMIPIGEKILKLICDMNFDAHPVIFHIFSNGGAYLYQHISLAIRKNNLPLQVRGMIFDSAPGERRILGLYRALNAIYGREQRKCNCITAIIITLTLSLMWFVEETFAAFKSLFIKRTVVAQKNPFHDLKNEPNQFPQLFLYSKADVVIPYQDVEKFMKIRQDQGVDVSSVCFEDAEHVKIFTKYPSQYIHCVCSFINNCLSMPYKAYAYATNPEPLIEASSAKKED